MSIWHVLIIALAISIDAFSVSVALSHRVHGFWPGFRLAFGFGFFQGLMPILGWLLGTRLTTIIGAWDHWVAFGILAAISIHMLIESLKPHEKKKSFDPTWGLALLGLSISVSIDALGVGLGMGILNAAIIIPSIIYCVSTTAMSGLGLVVGRVLKAVVGWRIETAAAVVLFIIALNMLRI